MKLTHKSFEIGIAQLLCIVGWVNKLPLLPTQHMCTGSLDNKSQSKSLGRLKLPAFPIKTLEAFVMTCHHLMTASEEIAI